ncbi:hypothetical protein [Streptomyces sp. NPDC012510]|uniref:hypothetical protein n=1 Tax=Streptomyces sp. NPDC012510 TaxID=3364838 RepID=UPI0036E03B86
MTYLIPLGLIVVLFVAMPWLAVVFSRYCDAVNRFLARRKPLAVVPDGEVCGAYQPPATSADSGLCARCGMSDYKHPEAADAWPAWLDHPADRPR